MPFFVCSGAASVCAAGVSEVAAAAAVFAAGAVASAGLVS